MRAPGWLVAGGLGLALGAWAAPAEACSCTFLADLIWPRPGATGVSTQLDIVVARGPLAIEVILEDASGKPIPLVERPVDPVMVRELCSAQLSFWTSAAALAPNTTYSMRFRVSDSAVAGLQPPPRTFTTGSGSPAPLTGPGFDVRMYRLSVDARCDPPTYEACGDYVEVELAGEMLEASKARQPFWVRLKSSSKGKEETAVLAGPLHYQYQPVVWAFLPIDTDEPCLSYEQFDASGKVVASGELCEPDKCASSSEDLLRPWVGCAFDDPGPEAWKLVGDDSCGAPPWISRDPKTDEVTLGLREPVEVSWWPRGALDAGTDAMVGDAADIGDAGAVDGASGRADGTGANAPPGNATPDSAAGNAMPGGAVASAAPGSTATGSQRRAASPSGCELATDRSRGSPTSSWLLAGGLLGWRRRHSIWRRG